VKNKFSFALIALITLSLSLPVFVFAQQRPNQAAGRTAGKSDQPPASSRRTGARSSATTILTIDQDFKDALRLWLGPPGPYPLLHTFAPKFIRGTFELRFIGRNQQIKFVLGALPGQFEAAYGARVTLITASLPSSIFGSGTSSQRMSPPMPRQRFHRETLIRLIAITFLTNVGCPATRLSKQIREKLPWSQRRLEADPAGAGQRSRDRTAPLVRSCRPADWAKVKDRRNWVR